MNKNMRKMYTEEEIKDIVNYAIEKGLVDNVKPIFCHPLTIQSITGTKTFRLTCLIFNNDATPFTLSSFKQWLDKVYSQIGSIVRIMLSGGYNDNNAKIIIASHLTGDTSSYYVSGMKVDGYTDYTGGSWNDLFPTETTSITDGVNKIN